MYNVHVFLYTPLKKSNATQLWSIIFLLFWIFIHQVTCRYPWQACLFAFRLMPYLLGLFHWGVSKISKRKSCKIDRIEWEMHVTCMSSFGLSFCECTCTRNHCPFIAPKSSESIGGFRCNEWAGQRVRAHTLHALTKGKPKTWYNMHFPFNPINFATFPFWYCPQFTHPACAPVKQS